MWVLRIIYHNKNRSIIYEMILVYIQHIYALVVEMCTGMEQIWVKDNNTVKCLRAAI